MTDTLKACPTPWCEQQRGEPYVFARRRDIVGVYCPSCSVTTPYFTTEAEAVTFWNTRAQSRPDPGVRELCERLRRSIPRGPLGAGGGMELVNPDGPEAAAVLEALAVRAYLTRKDQQ